VAEMGVDAPKRGLGPIFGSSRHIRRILSS
jgi:hypothetical protein